MGLSRQEYWSGLPFPPPDDLLMQRLNPHLLHFRQSLYCLSHQESPNRLTVECKHNFYVHWETNNFLGLALLWYLLYCGHPAPNPQHLRGLSVPSSPTPLCPACPLFYPIVCVWWGKMVSISFFPKGQQPMMVGCRWKKRKKRLIFNDSFRYY